MGKIKLYIATSMNLMIARENKEVDWLDSIVSPEGEDYGYAEFYQSVDITIMGANTFEQINSWDIDFPYSGKKNYVLTRKKAPKPHPEIEWINEKPVEWVKELKLQDSDIWLVGGSQISTLLLNHGLIDEIHLFMMPLILPSGIPLFGEVEKEIRLDLKEHKTYSNGVQALQYNLQPPKLS